MAETLRDFEMEQMFGKKDKPKRPINNANPECKCVHIDQRTRTSGTPYVKGWCNTCGAWVFTEKSFCICCMKRVKHKVHHLHTKRVMDKFVDEYGPDFTKYVQLGMDMAEKMFVETDFKDRRYHIPIKYVVEWSKNTNQKEIMEEILDRITTVRK